MNAREQEESIDRRAAAIIAESRIAAMIQPLLQRGVASAREARSWRLVERLARNGAALPGAERRAIALVIVAVAVGGHWLMASMLPASASPTPALSAVALVAASLAAVAATARSR